MTRTRSRIKRFITGSAFAYQANKFALHSRSNKCECNFILRGVIMHLQRPHFIPLHSQPPSHLVFPPATNGNDHNGKLSSEFAIFLAIALKTELNCYFYDLAHFTSCSMEKWSKQ